MDADKGDYVEEEGHLAPPPQLDGGGAVVDSEELRAGAQDERAAAATEAARLADGAKQAAQESALLEAREERDRLAAVASPLDEAKRSLEAARRKRDALYSQLESAEVHLATVAAARNAAERKLDRLAEREGRQRQVSPVRNAPPVSLGQAPSASDAKAMRDSLKRVKEEIRAMELRLPAHEEARFHVEKLQNERRSAKMRAAALKAEIRRLLDETTRERGVLAALEAGAAPTDTERRDNAEVVRLKTAIAAENTARASAERDAAATARKLRVVHTALAGFFTAHRLSSANCTREEHGAALAEYVAACSSTVHEAEKRVGFLEGKAERLQQLYDEAAGELTKVVHARTRRAMRRRRPLPALEPGIERAAPEELPAAPPPEPILERQRPWRTGTKPRSAATAPSPRLAKAAPKQAPKQARSPVRGGRRSGRKLEERAANVPTDRGASNSAPAPKPFFGLAAAETKTTEAAEPTQATVAQVVEAVEEEGAMADIDVTQAVGAMEYRGGASVARQGSDERTGAMAEQVAQDASTHHEPADMVGRGDAADMQEETAVAAVETSSKAKSESESEVEAVETLMPVLMPAEATEPSQGFTDDTQAEGEKGTETDEKREEEEDTATRLSTKPSPAQPEPSEATGKASKEREAEAEAEAEADMEAEVAVVEAEAEAEVLAVVDVEAEAEEESKAEAEQEEEQEGDGEAEVEADAKAGSEIEQDVSTTAVTAVADTLEGERVTVGQAEDGAVEDTTADKVGKEAKADEVEGSATPTWEAEVEGGAAAEGEAAAGRVEASEEAAGETAAPAAAPPPSDDLGVDDALQGQLPSSDDHDDMVMDDE